MVTTTANPTVWYDRAERQVHTVNCKAFAWQQPRTANRFIVDSDCKVLVWMEARTEFADEYDGGFFTEHHQLSAAIAKRILRMDGV